MYDPGKPNERKSFLASLRADAKKSGKMSILGMKLKQNSERKKIFMSYC